MATPFLSGTAGRVIADNIVVCGVKSWRLEQTAAEVPIPHFESPVDAFGRVWPEYLIGLCGATGTLEGEFGVTADLTGNPTDGFTTDNGNTGLAVGLPLTLQLIFNKATTYGFAVTAVVTALGAGTNVENQPASFTMTFRVTGIVPLSSIIV